MERSSFTPAVRFVLDEEIVDPKECYGGIQIEIDGNRLNKTVNEENEEWLNWGPEYDGQYLYTDMWNLISTTISVLQERSTYEEYSVSFLENSSRIIVEPLGESIIRIAYRTGYHECGGRKTVQAVPVSACGFPVDLYEWGEAVYDAGSRLRDNLVDLEREQLGMSLDPVLNDLRQELD